VLAISFFFPLSHLPSFFAGAPLNCCASRPSGFALFSWLRFSKDVQAGASIPTQMNIKTKTKTAGQLCMYIHIHIYNALRYLHMRLHTTLFFFFSVTPSPFTGLEVICVRSTVYVFFFFYFILYLNRSTNFLVRLVSPHSCGDLCRFYPMVARTFRSLTSFLCVQVCVQLCGFVIAQPDVTLIRGEYTAFSANAYTHSKAVQ
jgi:hypothetical protein